MKKLLLITSALTLIFTSFSFAKTYSIKKEKEGKYVEISQSDIEVILSKGSISTTNIWQFLLILSNMTRRYFIVLQMFF